MHTIKGISPNTKNTNTIFQQEQLKLFENDNESCVVNTSLIGQLVSPYFETFKSDTKKGTKIILL